jgi:hypothetical protein
MLLRHSTILRYLPSIERRGLLCSKSKGKLKVVWLHSPSQSGWALVHTVRRHGGRIEAVITIECEVPREWLRRSRKGLWYSVRDIPPERFKRIMGFAEVAGRVTVSG